MKIIGNNEDTLPEERQADAIEGIKGVLTTTEGNQKRIIELLLQMVSCQMRPEKKAAYTFTVKRDGRGLISYIDAKPKD